jgi:hypothetical protein
MIEKIIDLFLVALLKQEFDANLVATSTSFRANKQLFPRRLYYDDEPQETAENKPPPPERKAQSKKGVVMKNLKKIMERSPIITRTMANKIKRLNYAEK